MFFDNASSTKVYDEILDEFKSINDNYFYNPSSLYREGLSSKNLLEKCRLDIKKNLGARDVDSLIFTASATEANNLAVQGLLKKSSGKLLFSIGEHPSIYNTSLEIKEKGYQVEYINLSNNGKVDVEDFKIKMTKDVSFVSIIHVNNETGAINDIESLVKFAKSVNPNVVFHSDGVQAVGKIDVNLNRLGIDMYTMSAHKLHGMKGIGALYVKNKINLKPVIFGGGQENGIRSGTENIMGIYSLDFAIKKSLENINVNFDNVKKLKNILIDNIEKSNINYKLNSDESASPYIVSLSFKDCRGETILHMLNDDDIIIGNGSACSSKKIGNRILSNMNRTKNEIDGSVRISFSAFNSAEEVEVLSQKLVEKVKKYTKLFKNS